MNIYKMAKDRILRQLSGSVYVPGEVLEMVRYFNSYGPINFDYTQEGEDTVAVSTNFRYGAIVTSGKDASELDKNIKDAILTAFAIPSAYADVAKVKKTQDQTEKAYAAA